MRWSTRHSLVVIGMLAVLATPGCARQADAPVVPDAPSAQSPSTSTAPAPTPSTEPTTEPPVVFAVIGDYGTDGRRAREVAKLVRSWDPEFIIALGDNYYWRAGGRGTGKYDESTGKHYGEWLADIDTTGKNLPEGKAEKNAFFPALGNHDYSDATPSLDTYLKYFKLPGDGFSNSSDNERYYDFVQGPVHFFVVNSNPDEPDGIDRRSKQARWLRDELTSSTSAWKVVYGHHPPYSSDSTHGSTDELQWPYAEWGADLVLSGHSHAYERIERDGIVYLVNGLGGASRYRFDDEVEGSKKRYRSDWGAQRATATSQTLELKFYNTDEELIDEVTLTAE